MVVVVVVVVGFPLHMCFVKDWLALVHGSFDRKTVGF